MPSTNSSFNESYTQFLQHLKEFRQQIEKASEKRKEIEKALEQINEKVQKLLPNSSNSSPASPSKPAASPSQQNIVHSNPMKTNVIIEQASKVIPTATNGNTNATSPISDDVVNDSGHVKPKPARSYSVNVATGREMLANLNLRGPQSFNNAISNEKKSMGSDAEDASIQERIKHTPLENLEIKKPKQTGKRRPGRERFHSVIGTINDLKH
jgi:DNA polymerase III gamma/tau subunit